MLLGPMCIPPPPSAAALWPSDKWSSHSMNQMLCDIPDIKERIKDLQLTALRQGRSKSCLCIYIRYIEIITYYV